ncbi:MAG: methyltransferase domain-containing protein [Gilvibacter sp.]
MDANELMGQALLDFYQGDRSKDLYSESDISEKDRYPLDYFFREFDAMPPIEQKALSMCYGKVLDIGCGAGNHSLYLQQKGVSVTALDVSKNATKVCRLRGIDSVKCNTFLDYNTTTYDTLLLLMNGIGIAGSLDKLPDYLKHLKGLLNPGGQILVDSSDLQYMYDRAENGAIMVPAYMSYYGQLEYTLYYGAQKSDAFKWLYVDPVTFEQACKELDLRFEIVLKGDNYDFLARITA